MGGELLATKRPLKFGVGLGEFLELLFTANVVSVDM